MKALKENYKRNVEILQENLRRGMGVSQALQTINSWRKQFEAHNLYGEDEKAFINACLALLEPETHMTVKVM